MIIIMMIMMMAKTKMMAITNKPVIKLALAEGLLNPIQVPVIMTKMMAITNKPVTQVPVIMLTEVVVNQQIQFVPFIVLVDWIQVIMQFVY